MESDVGEKIFPEGASELRRTGSIIERRARRNLHALCAATIFSSTHLGHAFFIERKNASIKSGILNCHREKYSIRTFDKSFND